MGRVRRGSIECGSSVVAFLMGLPVLLLFLFAIIDLGRTALLYTAAQDGVHAACRVAAEKAADGVSEAALKEAMLEASPALAGDGLRLSVSVRFGDPEERSYAHHVYDGDAGSFEEVKRCVRWRDVEVGLVLEGRYLTPLGPLLAAASGHGGDGFAYKLRSGCAADATAIGGSL